MKRVEFSKIPDLINAPSTILLDIDGTLLADGEDVVPRDFVETVSLMKENHIVFLVTNSRKIERGESIAEQLGVSCVKSRYKKPNPKIIEKISMDTEKSVVVIGDKMFTDGLFARYIEAEFLLVERITCRRDRFLIKLSYLVDDACSVCVRLARLLKKM